MKSIIIAFSMYSKLPMPQIPWEKRPLSWALVAFPLVGVVMGAFLVAWLLVADALGLTALKAAGAILLLAVFSGGIHLDGFCDTCDALASHQPRERKLEILKDSHTGAFAILCCCLYFLVCFGAWQEVSTRGENLWVLGLVPVVSRCLAGLTAVSYQNARGSGLLATFTQPMDGKWARRLLLLFSATVILAISAIAFLSGKGYLLAVPISSLCTLWYYKKMAFSQFGGVTGDTSGFFLTLVECVAVVSLALGEKGWERL